MKLLELSMYLRGFFANFGARFELIFKQVFI